MKKCYVIKKEVLERTNHEEILFSQGIFATKKLAIQKIKELADIISTSEGMTVYDISNKDDFCINIRYSSCMACPEYDINCTGECYKPRYKFTIVEYDFVES
jgi:hypothetical protein